MNATEQQIEKLQCSTGGSLVAGIIAGSDQQAQQQVNAGPDGVKVSAKTDHIMIDHWMTPTAYDQTIEAEASRRAVFEVMTKTGIDLSNWAQQILAYKLGVFFYTDDRRMRVSPVLEEGLLAIAPLFEVNNRLEYWRFTDLFDAYGWRCTSIYDLRQLGRGRTNNFKPFSKREVRFILDELEFAGFLENKKPCDSDTCRNQLFIRFRPDRIQQAIKAISFLNQTEADRAAELNTTFKTVPSAGTKNL